MKYLSKFNELLKYDSTFDYSDSEKTFIDYFDRCKSIGMSISEIERNLKGVQKYYKKMIPKDEQWENRWSKDPLKALFDEWG